MKPIKIDGLNCLDNVVLTLCNEYYGDYCQAMWNAWQFSYKKHGVLSLGFTDSLDVKDNVRKYYGLDFKIVCKKYSKEMLEEIKEKLKNGTHLIIGIDIFECHWTTDYQIRHNPHALIITEVSDNFFQCVDVMYEKYEVEIPIKEVRKGFMYLVEPIVSEASEKNQLHKYDLSQMRKSLIKQVKRNFKEKELVSLLEDFRNVSWEKEFGKEHNIWYINLYTALGKVYSGHIHFARFLQKCKEKEQVEIDEILIEQLEDVGNKWHAICLWVFYVHMSYMKGDDKKHKYTELIIKNLEKIVPIETEIRKEVLMFLRNLKGNQESKEKVIYQTYKLPYNVKSHLISKEHDEFIITDCFETGRELCFAGKKFEIQSLEPGKEVMGCMGQEIRIGRKIQRCDFLGCGIWGDQLVSFQVVYENGNIEEKEVYVSDWNATMTEEQNVVWSSAFTSKVEGVNDCIAKVYQFGFFCNQGYVVDKIIMPQNEHVHIFATTTLNKY